MSARDEIRIKKFFVWEFEGFDGKLMLEHRFPWPVVKAYDSYNNVERKAKIRFEDKRIFFEITPPVKSMKFYCLINDYHTEYNINQIFSNWDFKLLQVCIDVVVPFQMSTLEKKLQALLENDPLNKFTIKCQSETIETFKHPLAAWSPVFKAMFESGIMKENTLEIADFKPKVVKKMVEFCQTNANIDFEGLEEDVFKIAATYQIENLMQYAICEMMRTTTNENRLYRYKLTEPYGWVEFKKSV